MQVKLADHHYWGGLRATQHLAHICRTSGINLSMHSSSHLGISLAAMTHVGVTMPNLTYVCDTHYPWQPYEVIAGGKLRFKNEVLAPPEGGVDVKLDQDALARLNDNYLRCGIRVRDGASEMLKHQPNWKSGLPRF